MNSLMRSRLQWFIYLFCLAIALFAIRQFTRTSYPECLDPLVTIIESPNIHSIDCFLNTTQDPKHTLILFDIDNTLIEPETELGSDQWFVAMIEKKNKEEKINKETALKKVLSIYSCLQQHIDIKLIETITPSYIEKLKANGYMVAALTARSCSLADVTINQLERVGISFAANTNLAIGVAFTDTPTAACYKAGILFCEGGSKGEILLNLFKKINYTPEKVIFIDDKFYNILSVQNSIENEHIKFVGIRYSRLDTKVQQFSLERTAGELEQFCIEHPEINIPAPTESAKPLTNTNQGAL